MNMNDREPVVTQHGGNKNCRHERTIDTGRGTVCFFTKCLDCGAELTHSCGDDPYLAQLEASREPPYK